MTLPTSDAQSSRFPLSHQPNSVPTHSMIPALPPSSPQTPIPPPFTSDARLSNDLDDDRTIDVAMHSWDLATGGLKTLTAKRELPSLLERRPTEKLFADPTGVPRSYAFLLIIMVVSFLNGENILFVLFVMVQP